MMDVDMAGSDFEQAEEPPPTKKRAAAASSKARKPASKATPSKARGKKAVVVVSDCRDLSSIRDHDERRVSRRATMTLMTTTKVSTRSKKRNHLKQLSGRIELPS